MSEIKEEVKQFYDQVGWKLVGEDVYQNARYEDLRPVAREYIQRCHLRVGRHLKSTGRLLLDAGSGPVQYEEYVDYGRGYQYRVCVDISITALVEARRRLGDRGLYVVADIANLPFAEGLFDGVVSLHTIHHLPEEEHLQAYQELYRMLAPGSVAVVVNGWPSSPLLKFFEPLVRLGQRLNYYNQRRRGYRPSQKITRNVFTEYETPSHPGEELNPRVFAGRETSAPKGTFTSRRNAAWIKTVVGAYMPLEILVWRSVSVRFMRALIHERLAGRAVLGLLYRLEERFSHFFGEKGKYPLIVIRKKQEN